MPGRVALLVMAAGFCCGLTSTPFVDVAFELYRGHLIVVPAGAGARDDLRLLVDTGTSRTVVDLPVAASLGLTGLNTSVRTFGRTMAGADVVLPQLRIGDTRADDLRVVATDLSATVASLGLDRLDGIVGMDVLGRTSFAIDYARRRLSFGARTRTRHRIPPGPDPVFPVVNVDIAGIPAELIVDTGASHVVLFLPAGDRTFERVGTIAASMLGGSAAIQGLLLPELRLGAFRMRDLPAVIAEAPVPTRPVKGLLAPTVLGSTFLQFDFSRQELGWRP